jgi:hypothetical protein
VSSLPSGVGIANDLPFCRRLFLLWLRALTKASEFTGTCARGLPDGFHQASHLPEHTQPPVAEAHPVVLKIQSDVLHFRPHIEIRTMIHIGLHNRPALSAAKAPNRSPMNCPIPCLHRSTDPQCDKMNRTTFYGCKNNKIGPVCQSYHNVQFGAKNMGTAS